MDTLIPIVLTEHLQLTSLGVQPDSISLKVCTSIHRFVPPSVVVDSTIIDADARIRPFHLCEGESQRAGPGRHYRSERP